jgi:hypothetical protein
MTYEKKAPLVAEPSHNLTEEANGGSSDGGCAVGNACAAWRCPCGGSASSVFDSVAVIEDP